MTTATQVLESLSIQNLCKVHMLFKQGMACVEDTLDLCLTYANWKSDWNRYAGSIIEGHMKRMNTHAMVEDNEWWRRKVVRRQQKKPHAMQSQTCRNGNHCANWRCAFVHVTDPDAMRAGYDTWDGEDFEVHWDEETLPSW